MASYAFHVRGIEPRDPAWHFAGETTRRAFWRAVVGFVLVEKDRELAAGLDRFGRKMVRIAASTRAKGRWRSHTGMGSADAPPLDPAYAISRTRSLFTGRALIDHAEFYWGVDDVSGQHWGRILGYHRDGAGRLPIRDVIGLSPGSLARVRKAADAWWLANRPGAVKPAPPVVPPPSGRPIPARIPLVGRTDLHNAVFGKTGGRERSQRAIDAGLATGFRQLPPRASGGGAARPAPAPTPAVKPPRIPAGTSAGKRAADASEKARKAEAETARLRAKLETERLARIKAEKEAAEAAARVARQKAEAEAIEAAYVAKLKAERLAREAEAERIRGANEIVAQLKAERLAREAGPGRPILPGKPIAERLKAYTEGDRKVAEMAKHGREIESLNTRIAAMDAEQIKLQDAYEASGFSRTFEGNARLIAIYAEVPALRKQRRLALEQSRPASFAIMAPADPIPVKMTGLSEEASGKLGMITNTMAAKRDEASAWLGSMLGRGIQTEPVHVGVGMIPPGKDKRAYYLDRIRSIAATEATDTGVYVHEAAHMLEYRMAGSGEGGRARDSVFEFLSHRVGDEKPARLKDVFPDSTFDDDEYGRKDKFDAVFDGPSAYYVGKDYNGRATEVLSMGVERLYRDPAGFAAKDPEYVKFLLGFLDGSLR